MSFAERKLGEIHKLKYYFIFPGGRQKLAGEMTLVHPLSFEMTRFGFLKDRPELSRDILQKGECRWVDHNGVTHLVQIKLDKNTKY